MTILFFTGIDPHGNYHESSYGGENVETGLEVLAGLVRKGWQLTQITLLQGKYNRMKLPLEAFDGQPMQQPIKELRHEWEELLYQV